MIPVDGGRKIFSAARPPKQLVILHGYRHNDLSQKPTEGWWSAVPSFIKAPNPPTTSHSGLLPTPEGTGFSIPPIAAGIRSAMRSDRFLGGQDLGVFFQHPAR